MIDRALRSAWQYLRESPSSATATLLLLYFSKKAPTFEALETSLQLSLLQLVIHLISLYVQARLVFVVLHAMENPKSPFSKSWTDTEEGAHSFFIFTLSFTVLVWVICYVQAGLARHFAGYEPSNKIWTEHYVVIFTGGVFELVQRTDLFLTGSLLAAIMQAHKMPAFQVVTHRSPWMKANQEKVLGYGLGYLGLALGGPLLIHFAFQFLWTTAMRTLIHLFGGAPGPDVLQLVRWTYIGLLTGVSIFYRTFLIGFLYHLVRLSKEK